MTSNAISVKPIRSEEDHELAISRIEQLMTARPGTRESDGLDVLATLVVAYEKEHHPRLPPKPQAVIEFRMDQQGMTRKDLEPFIGSRARVSEVLSGKRQLTLAMIRRLSVGLGVSADLLIGKVEVKPRRRPVRVVKKAAGKVRTSERAAGIRPNKKLARG